MLTVRELRKALKLFPEDKVVTVFLSILDDNLDYITGIQFDVESWGENGKVFQLNISEVLQELVKYATER